MADAGGAGGAGGACVSIGQPFLMQRHGVMTLSIEAERSCASAFRPCMSLTT